MPFIATPAQLRDEAHIELAVVAEDGVTFDRAMLDVEARHLNAMVRAHHARCKEVEKRAVLLRQATLAGPMAAA